MSEIEADSASVIADLAAVLKGCAGVKVEVALKEAGEALDKRPSLVANRGMACR